MKIGENELEMTQMTVLTENTVGHRSVTGHSGSTILQAVFIGIDTETTLHHQGDDPDTGFTTLRQLCVSYQNIYFSCFGVRNRPYPTLLAIVRWQFWMY